MAWGLAYVIAAFIAVLGLEAVAQPRIPDDEPTARFFMGGSEFVMPRSYFFPAAPPRDGTKFTDGISFLLILPELSPPTSDTLHLTRERGWGRIAHVGLVPRRTHLMGDALLALWSKDAEAQPLTELEHGFQVFPLRRPFDGDELLIKKSSAGAKLFLRCAGWKRVPPPSCEQHILLPPDIRLSVSYGRPFLSEAERIYETLIARFIAFRVRPGEWSEPVIAAFTRGDGLRALERQECRSAAIPKEIAMQDGDYAKAVIARRWADCFRDAGDASGEREALEVAVPLYEGAVEKARATPLAYQQLVGQERYLRAVSDAAAKLAGLHARLGDRRLAERMYIEILQQFPNHGGAQRGLDSLRKQ